MSPHTPDHPPADDRRSRRPDRIARRAIERLRRIGAETGASIGALIDRTVAPPTPLPAVVPVARQGSRRNGGGVR